MSTCDVFGGSLWVRYVQVELCMIHRDPSFELSEVNLKVLFPAENIFSAINFKKYLIYGYYSSVSYTHLTLPTTPYV